MGYEYGKMVYEAFECENFQNYHQLYLLTDVLLLRDIMHQFQQNMIRHFKLDPYHYISLPSYTEGALLYHLFKKDKEIGILKDEQNELFEEFMDSVKGGICVANKLFTEKQDEESNFYFDANSLYLWSERNKLPAGDFIEYFPSEDGLFRNKEGEILYDEEDYSNEKELSDFLSNRVILPKNPVDLIQYEKYEDKGEFLVCDVKIPEKLHDYFNDYPPCVEKRDVIFSDLGIENREKFEFSRHQNIQENTKISKEKLIPNLEDKKGYLIHVALFRLV